MFETEQTDQAHLLGPQVVEKAAGPQQKEMNRTQISPAKASEAVTPVTGDSSDAVSAGSENSTHSNPDSDSENENENASAAEAENESDEEDSRPEQKTDSEHEASDDADDGDCSSGETQDVGSSPKKKPVSSVLMVGNKTYSSSSFVPNRGFVEAQGRLRGDPKSIFRLCSTMRPHNILQCHFLHLTSRAILVGDRYVRLNMLQDGAEKTALLENPSKALEMEFCRDAHNKAEGRGAVVSLEDCTKLHLRPNIVFIGIPGLRTGYYEMELHLNLGLTKLQQQAWDTQCGTWCHKTHSHVITTCRFLHYRRGPAYSERPNAPSLPLALIPELTPRPPRKPKVTLKPGEHGVRAVPASQRKTAGRGGRVVPLPPFIRPSRPVAARESVALQTAFVSPVPQAAPGTRKIDPVRLPRKDREDPVDLDVTDVHAKNDLRQRRLLLVFLGFLLFLVLLLVYAIKRPLV